MASDAAVADCVSGSNRELSFPVHGLAGAKAVVVVSGDPAEPLLMTVQHLEEQRQRDRRFIVATPRCTATAGMAAPVDGLPHTAIRDGMIERDVIVERTTSFGTVRRIAYAYCLRQVEHITATPDRRLVQTANIPSKTEAAAVLTARDPKQEIRGVGNAGRVHVGVRQVQLGQGARA